jgi:hypothetical protein
MSTARACSACADAWTAAAAGGQPGTQIGTAQFATPPTASVMQTIAATETGYITDITSEWNIYAGWSNLQILQNAAAMLQSFQATVLKVGQLWRPSLANDCPALAAALPQGPDTFSQAQLIANIEGAGILASGALQVLGIGLNGSFGAIGSAAEYVGKKVDQTTNFILSPWPWIAVTTVALAGAAVYVTKNAGVFRRA